MWWKSSKIEETTCHLSAAGFRMFLALRFFAFFYRRSFLGRGLRFELDILVGFDLDPKRYKVLYHDLKLGLRILLVLWSFASFSRHSLLGRGLRLELDILVGFNLDPKRYKVLYHDLKPANQPCGELKDLKSLKDKDVDKVVTGPYEVHFELRDKRCLSVLKGPSELAGTLADRPRRSGAEEHVHSLQLAWSPCNSRPRQPHDVETTLRHDLGLATAEGVGKGELRKALKLGLEGKEVKFHLNQEDCANLRDLSELATTTLAPNNIVKLHLPLSGGAGLRSWSADLVGWFICFLCFLALLRSSVLRSSVAAF